MSPIKSVFKKIRIIGGIRGKGRLRTKGIRVICVIRGPKKSVLIRVNPWFRNVSLQIQAKNKFFVRVLSKNGFIRSYVVACCGTQRKGERSRKYVR